MMAKIIFFWLFLFFSSYSKARSVMMNQPEQNILNRSAKETDTIFIGQVLKQMIIKDGLVYENGDSDSLVVLEYKVLKTYRGKEPNNKKQIVCTWFLDYDPPYFDSSQKDLIFGIQTNSTIQLPTVFDYIRNVPKDESKIYKALKLKRKKIKDKSNILGTFSDSKVIRNACNEPIVWSE